MTAIPTVIDVVCGALTTRSGLVLMQKCAAGHVHAGKWEFPGGKIEPGETKFLALFRELREELGIEIDLSRCERVATVIGQEDIPIALSLFHCDEWVGDPVPLVAEQLGFFSIEEIADLETAELDHQLAVKLRSFLTEAP